MGVTHRPGPAAAKLNAALKELDGVKGAVGWFETAKYADSTPVAYVACIQEFGDGKIPPRPFMRPTMAAQQQVWADLARAWSRRVIRGEVSAIAMMDRVGLQAAGDISKTIANITTPPLSPVTIELRRRAREGDTINGRAVGEAAQAVQSGDAPGGNAGASENKPLVFSGIMLATLTHTVEGGQ
jgi:hypothetical protein